MATVTRFRCGRSIFLGFWNSRVRKVATVTRFCRREAIFLGFWHIPVRTLATVARFCCGRSMFAWFWHGESHDPRNSCHLGRLFRGMCVEQVYFPDSVYRFGVDQLIADAPRPWRERSQGFASLTCAKAMIVTLRIGCSMSLAGTVRLRCNCGGELCRRPVSLNSALPTLCFSSCNSAEQQFAV